MPVVNQPRFSPQVANRALKEHGLEGKVTAEQLADAARAHDQVNPGYISADEFAAAAAGFKAQLGGPSDAPTTPVGGAVHSPLFARGAVLAPKADLARPEVAKAKERILANAGPGARFGALDAGQGLRAFTIDDATLARVRDPDLKDKLNAIGGAVVFAVLTTGDHPELTIASAGADRVRVAGKYDLLDPASAKLLGGGDDPLKAAAKLFGESATIELGGEDPTWTLGSGDWTTGQAFKAKTKQKAAASAARDAARAARRAAADVALAGPKSVADFAAAGVATVPHTPAEKKALLELVKKNAGEDALFPNPDDSYYGLHVYLQEGAKGAYALALATAGGAGAFDFDPAKHSVLTTVKSFDEAQVGTWVVDRQSGEVLFGDEANGVDIDGRVASAFFGSRADDAAGDLLIIGTLASQGEQLGVVAGSNAPDDMDFADWLNDA